MFLGGGLLDLKNNIKVIQNKDKGGIDVFLIKEHL